MDSRAIVLALAVAALSACGSAEPPPFTTTLTAKNASGTFPGVFALGEPVIFTVVTTNHTDRALDITWCAGQNLMVFDSDNNLVWSLGEGGSLGICGPGPDTYAPGEQRRWEWTWHQDYNDGEFNFEPGTFTPIIGDERVPAGTYYAVVEGNGYVAQEHLSGSSSRPVDFLIR
jgi:hypothetical protein